MNLIAMPELKLPVACSTGASIPPFGGSLDAVLKLGIVSANLKSNNQSNKICTFEILIPHKVRQI